MSGCDVGSRTKPFHLNPDPRYFYCGPTHRRVLASLLGGIDDLEVPIVLTGQSGTGKTALIHEVLLKLPPETYTVWLRYTTLSVDDLIDTLASELGISPGEPPACDLLATIRVALEVIGPEESAPVLIVDEAQNLCSNGLSTLCDLSRDGLLKLVLVGQPQLREQVAALRPHARSAATVRVLELDNLPADESRDLVRHRLQISGADPEAVFPAEAFDLIYEQTSGNPRRINVLCERALEFAESGSSPDECMDALRDAAASLAEELPSAPFLGVGAQSAASSEGQANPGRGGVTPDGAGEPQMLGSPGLSGLLSDLALAKPRRYTLAALGVMLVLVAVTAWLVNAQSAGEASVSAVSSDELPNLRKQMASLNESLAKTRANREALLGKIEALQTENRMLREQIRQSAPVGVALGKWQAPVIEDFAALEMALLSGQKSEPRLYRVQAGDTLFGVAHRHQLSLSQIARWNGLATDSGLRVGERLALSPREELNYTVRWGDTLSSLKRRFNVTLYELRRWNDLPGDGGLVAGQRLRIYVSLPFES